MFDFKTTKANLIPALNAILFLAASFVVHHAAAEVYHRSCRRTLVHAVLFGQSPMCTHLEYATVAIETMACAVASKVVIDVCKNIDAFRKKMCSS
jgi:hypothetical protein